MESAVVVVAKRRDSLTWRHASTMTSWRRLSSSAISFHESSRNKMYEYGVCPQRVIGTAIRWSQIQWRLSSHRPTTDKNTINQWRHSDRIIEDGRVWVCVSVQSPELWMSATMHGGLWDLRISPSASEWTRRILNITNAQWLRELRIPSLTSDWTRIANITNNQWLN